MSKYVSLDLFKTHVRADDFADDDDYLEHLLESAEVSVVQYTNSTADELEDAEGNLPLPLVHAVLLLAGHWYNQREAVAATQMHAIPMCVQSLVRPYRRLVRDEEG